MILLYSWKKIHRAAKGSCNKIVAILDMIANNRKIVGRNDPRARFYDMDFSGLSFLLNAEGLLLRRRFYTNKEIAQYLALASLRSHAEYVMTGKTYLDIVKVSMPLELIQNNRLLKIEEDRIRFLFEEKGDKDGFKVR